MKIAFITEDIFGESVGGVEYHIYNMSKELAKLNNEICIFTNWFKVFLRKKIDI